VKKVLVVDDEKDILDIVEFVLRSENFEVQALSGATKVLEAARAFQPDLFLIDYLLPEINGAELCRLLKVEEHFKKIPVILFSALPKDMVEAAASGCDELLPKPFDMDVLVDMVQRLTASAAQIEP
jgi:DNA-binding response OmpR family regulator